jgi:hypothetical protein
MSTLDRMEQLAYTLARSDYCFPERDSEKIAAAELFDYIIGTEIGAVEASLLTRTT